MYPQQNYGQAQQLPFSPDQIQVQFINGLGPANPPFVPNIQGIAQYLVGYVPTVAGWVAAEIQNTAESSALRRFFFNMFGQNRFVNEDFTSLVQSVLDYMEVQLASNPNLRVENILEKSIMHTVEMVISQMTRVFPQLNGYLNPQQQHNVQQQIAALDQIRLAIQQLRNRSGMIVQPQGYMVQPQQGMYPQPMMGRPDPRLAGGNLGMNLNVPQLSLSNNGFPGQVPMIANPQGRSMSDRWAGSNLPDLSTPTRQVGTVVNQPDPQQEQTSNVRVAPSSMPSTYNTNQNQEPTTVSTPVSQDGQMEPYGESDLKWTRSDLQPYFPAWNPSMQRLYLQHLDSGIVVARMKRLDEGEMEYDRHKLPSVFGPVIPKLDLSDTRKTLAMVSVGLDEIRQEKRERAEQIEASFSTRVNQTLTADVSHEMIWLKVACNWLQASEKGTRPDIYRQYGSVVELVVGTENEENFIESFREAGSFARLYEMLNEAYGVCSPTLWHKVNDRITELVNRVLSFNLSLSGWSIDSFALDGTQILEYLKSEFGEVVLAAFTQNQSYLIRSIFEKVSDSVRDDIDGIFLTTPEPGSEIDTETTTPVFTHLVSNASFTFLNCLAHELSLEWAVDGPAILTQALTPVMYQLVEGIIEESKTQLESTVARHFIQTLDGRIMEVDTGFIGDETFLVRVVK
jgi:hypothetical protein